MSEVIKELKTLDPCHLFFILIVIGAVFTLVYDVSMRLIRVWEKKSKEKE